MGGDQSPFVMVEPAAEAQGDGAAVTAPAVVEAEAASEAEAPPAPPAPTAAAAVPGAASDACGHGLLRPGASHSAAADQQRRRAAGARAGPLTSVFRVRSRCSPHYCMSCKRMSCERSASRP